MNSERDASSRPPKASRQDAKAQRFFREGVANALPASSMYEEPRNAGEVLAVAFPPSTSRIPVAASGNAMSFLKPTIQQDC